MPECRLKFKGCHTIFYGIKLMTDAFEFECPINLKGCFAGLAEPPFKFKLYTTSISIKNFPHT